MKAAAILRLVLAVAASCRASPPEAGARELALDRGGPGKRRHGGRDAVEQVLRCLSRPVSIRSQFDDTSAAVSATTSPKTCGWRRTSLSVIVRATSPRSNSPSSRASVAWKTTWHKTSPSSSSSVGDALGRGLRRVVTERLDGLDRLVGLLEQVAHERDVRLLPVPGAFAAAAGQPSRSAGRARRRPGRARCSTNTLVR